MGIKYYNIPVENELLDEFKKVCDKYEIKPQTVIKGLMSDFVKKEYDIILSKKGVSLRRHTEEDDEKAN